MTEIAHASGLLADVESETTLALAYTPPLAWASLLAFLAARAIPGVEHVGEGVYARSFVLGDARGVLEVRRAGDGESGPLALTVRARGAVDRVALVDRVRRLLDLDADPRAVAAHLATDPRLAKALAARPGLRVPGAWDPFELAVRAVLGQQVTVRGATTIAGRLVARLGDALPAGAMHAQHPSLTRLFPPPSAFAAADLTGLGVPGARAEALRTLAAATDRGEVLGDASHARGSRALVEELTALPGIGPWTAQYVAMRAGRDPDAFPASDLVLRKVVAHGGPLPTARALERLAEAWRPWRAYAALYLWSLAGDLP